MRITNFHRWIILALIQFLGMTPALGCIWDYDTLRDEQRGLPGVAELLAGRFERRSQFFYRDRIARMEKLLANDPNNQDAIDNLAVALFRDDQFDRAVAVLKDKEKRFPSKYTTASNLATFYMLHGEIEKAIPLLEKALSINPNAHFGREKYQLELAKFLRDAKDADAYPLKDFLGNESLKHDEKGISENLETTMGSRHLPGRLAPVQQEAMNAIIGMIRFGTDQSPDLYYALGNLLLLRGDRNLAYRAYQRAVDLNHPHAKHIKDPLMRSVYGMISEDQTQPTPELIASERAAGEAWANAYMGYADDLLRRGKDPDDDSQYAAFYREYGQPIPPLAFSFREFWRKMDLGPKLLIFAFGAAGVLALFKATLRRRKRRNSTQKLAVDGV